jgi:hypothetical protein
MFPKLPSMQGKRTLFALAGALLVSLGVAAPTLADNTVTTTVIGGIRDAHTYNLNLGSFNYSHDDQVVGDTMVLWADDSSGTNAGWNVTIVASNFAYAGPNGGVAIPNSNFAITGTGFVNKLKGQGVTPPHGPQVPATSPAGTLNTPRKVIFADPGHGKGTYEQDIDVELLIPGTSVAGTYTSNLTVTISAGP